MMNSIIMKAILAMDSYNRGYNPSITFGNNPSNWEAINGVTKIGNATVLRSQNSEQAQNISFYAIAYDYNGEKVISYRGTDDFALDGLYGFGVGGGFPHGQQALMAFQFYRDVAGNVDPRTANISLTGHSMGAGFAGLVGAAYTKEGLLFDNMAFTNAANNLDDWATSGGNYSPDLHRIAYNNTTPWDVNFSGLTGLYIKGESLGQGYTPGNHKFQSIAETEFTLGYEAKDLSDRQKHSMASLVMVMYGEDIANKHWKAASQYFWPVLYNDTFAQSIGFDENYFQGRDVQNKNNSSVLRQALAYSVIDDGVLLFGNTGIVSLFDDANDLGLALTGSNVSSLITSSAPDLSKLMVQFAGQLALSEVEKNKDSDVVSGVLSFTSETNGLGINLNDEHWRPAFSFMNDQSLQTPTIMALRENTISKLLTIGGISTAFLNDTTKLWTGTGLASIEYVILAGKTAGTLTIDGADMFGSVPSLYIGLQTSDQVLITGSINRAMIMTGNGDDIVSIGDDILYINDIHIFNTQIDGGLGNDTLTYKIAKYEDASIDMSSNLTFVQGMVSEFYIKNFEILGLLHVGDYNVKMGSPSGITIDSGSRLSVSMNGALYASGEAVDVDYSSVKSGMSFTLQTLSSQLTNPPISTAKLKSSTAADSLINIEGVFGTNYGDDYTVYAAGRVASVRIYSGTGNDTVIGPVADYFYTGGNDIITPHENVTCEHIYTEEGGIVVWLPHGVEQDEVTFTRINLKNLSSTTFSYDVLVSVAGHGTITLKNFRAKNIGSENEIVFSGFWGVKSQADWAYKLIDDYEFLSVPTVWNRYYQGSSSDDVMSIDSPNYAEGFGYSGNDIITGSESANLIDGGFGDDTLLGEGGSDTLIGGQGNDRIYGGLGSDSLKGQSGNDLLSGGDGDDLYWAGSGLDEIQDSSGNDTLYMEYLNYSDVEISLIGADLKIIDNIGFSEILIKNNSIENVVFEDEVSLGLSNFKSWEIVSEDIVYQGSFENNIILGGFHNDIVHGNAGNDKIIGNKGDDILGGGIGNDILYGSDGNDILNGGIGNDTMIGGRGNDTYYVDSVDDKIPGYDDEGFDTVITNLVSYDFYAESMILSGDFSIIAQASSYDGDFGLIHGNNNNNYIRGYGDINIYAGGGSDFIEAGSGGFVSGGDGHDVAFFSEYSGTYADYSITINSESYVLKNISWASQPVVTISKDVEVLQFSDGIYANGVFKQGNVDTSKYDSLIGTPSDDIFFMSYDGDADQISGGFGNDTYIIQGEVSEIIIEGENAGTDSITAFYTYTLPNNVENLFLVGSMYYGARASNGTGNNLDNIIAGNGYKNTLTGLGGNDTYHINNTTDVVVEALNAGTDHIKSNVTYTISANVENLTLVGVESINGTGNTLDNVIIGNDFANTLNGGSGNDIIDGAGENDILIGGLGIDQLTGGAGDDTYNISLNSGLDTISDISGNDKIVMGSGISTSNILYARSGNDLIISVSGSQIAKINGHFSSGGSVETLQFSTGSTVNLTTLTFPIPSINGTAGNDTLTGTSGNDVINGLAGNDTLNGNGGSDTFDGGTGIDIINGAAGNDIYNIALNSGLDTITDSSGVDRIIMGTGITSTNTTYARIGNDLIVSVSGTQAARILNHYSGTGAVETLQFSNGTTVNLQTVSTSINGTAGNDTVNGTTGNDVINGLAGNDILNGNGGNDTFDGGTGTDTINGAAGNDTYNIALNSGLDTITDTSGTEKIVFGAGLNRSAMTLSRDSVNKNDLNILFSGVKIAVVKNHFSGTGNVETLQFSDGTTYNLLTHAFAFNGTTASETLTGHIGVDVINGGTGNDILYGGGGNDTLSGQSGNDTLRGEAGNDIYVYDGGLDKIYETSGTDVLKLAAAMKADSLVFSDVGTVDTKMTFAAGTNDITLYGQRGTNANLKVETVQFADGFSANLATYKTWIWGSTAAQTTNGTANADTILGRTGNDTINGNAGNDALHGGDGNDIVRGGDGNDLINGGIGNDMLYGDAGNDVIYGDDGLDTLYGGTGADSFMFLKETAFKNIDVISDFKKTELDKINIADLLQGYDPLTKAITDYVQITTSGANSILRVDADGGANGFVQIATINGVTGLTDEQSLVSSGNLVVI